MSSSKPTDLARKRTTNTLAPAKQIAKVRVTIKNSTPPVRRNESSSIADRLIRLLQTSKGATMAQMQEATGWQPHSVRGTISAVLRKKRGLNVSCTLHASSGERRYRIVRTPSANL